MSEALFGFGTSHNTLDDPFFAVLTALKNGIRLIDTATRYGSESAVGKAIKESGLPRESVTIITKCWVADTGSRQKVVAACQASLKKLGVEYVDIYLLHWPGCGSRGGSPASGRREAWLGMNECLSLGLTRSIGVSNFLPHHLQDLYFSVDGQPVNPPEWNQIEFNPMQQPTETLQYCRSHHIKIQGYCPMGKGSCLRDKVVHQVARECGQSPAQVLIRWNIQHNVTPIVSSSSPEHIKDNADVLGFELTKEQMERLNALNCNLRSTWDPTFEP